MMLPFAFILAMGLPLVGTNVTISYQARWTYKLRCFDCEIINNFNCAHVRECPYDIRRCMTISVRLNPRELLIYKNCTTNCTFLYHSQVPPEAPRRLKTNSFYFVRCCGGMQCNEGGPSTIDQDISLDSTIEEPIPEGTVSFGESKSVLILASIIVRNALT
ncbi:glycosyl-phosphatidylinositol-anchored molecule-like protein [Microcebus murinus]|uniref:glycosyl-phosphatidylinositol-anchored molecule-like protein n=1 Tax=Microcebus murinus TaxID=30608 RepID=UPI003F6C6E0A